MNKKHISPEKNYRFLLPLSLIYLTALLSTVPLAYKMVSLGPLQLTITIFIFPITYTMCDVITEVYGYQTVRQIIWYSVICDLLFGLIETAFSHIHSSNLMPHQDAYIYVLGSSFQAVLGGTIGMILGDFLNVFLLSKWKIKLKGRLFWLRTLSSSALGQAITLLIACVIVFAGKLSSSHFWELIISMYSIQLGYALIGVFPASYLAKYLKKAENSDVFDHNTNFNPFKLKIIK